MREQKISEETAGSNMISKDELLRELKRREEFELRVENGDKATLYAEVHSLVKRVATQTIFNHIQYGAAGVEFDVERN